MLKHRHKRGRLLTWAEVKALPNGAFVWVYCEKDGRKRINESAQLERYPQPSGCHEQASWSLGPIGDLSMRADAKDDSDAIEHMSNYVTWVYEVVEVN